LEVVKDIYATGYIYLDNMTQTIVWKNETKMTITNETDDCGLWDLFITKE